MCSASLAVYALQRVERWLPLNPQHFGAVSPDSAMNTAISFATNTNWQGCAGESTMSYLIDMLALAVQNFLSAATGIAVLVHLPPSVMVLMLEGDTVIQFSTLQHFWIWRVDPNITDNGSRCAVGCRRRA
ncbi:MAG TPA: potassium-transporting ATPase subunit KdpA [Rhodanobacteraceae bacterium]|nr:potassium-transporting ATPase subunit KdpA [Rhodanobacteraceae bacterium]